MSLTAAQLIQIAPAALPYASLLLRFAGEMAIDTPRRQAHFLAQIAVESGGFRRVRESLNYSVEGLLDAFGRHRISVEDCQRYGRCPAHPAHQIEIANRIYGGEFGRRQLGNTEAGDGARFIGRGLKQITGRANYRACSRDLFGDDRLLQSPALLEDPELAARSAAWFWSTHDLNRLADADNIMAITQTVNGGSNGLADRRAWLERFKRVVAA